MKILRHIAIQGSKEKPITLDVFYKSNNKPKPVVIFVHGFKGFKDWGHFNMLAETFAEADCVFVKFNFSYNGTTPQSPLSFEDLEAFGNNNYLIELEDLDLVLNWVLNNSELQKEINKYQVCLLGHSRGGGISILKASEDSRITKLVTWAAVSDFINRNQQHTIDRWSEQGVIYTFNTRTKQQMPLYYQFYETIQQNKSRLNIIKAANQLNMPFLIIHGTADEAVSIQDAKELHKACKYSELLILDGAGHTFEVRHPFYEEYFPDSAQIVINNTLRFIKS